jgi:acetyl esterase/lipase
MPGGVVAFSPWLDMENRGETLVTNDATDALITVPLLESMIAGVLAGGEIDPRTPLANPLHADLTGLPRLYVNAGAVESLVDNATRLAEQAAAAGVDVTLSVVDGMQHVFPCLAGNAHEADTEIVAIAAWYRG